MRIWSVAVVAVMAFSPMTASAQSSGYSTRSVAALAPGRVADQFAIYQLDIMTAEWRQQSAPHRVRRAHRAADLINSGDCAGARRLVAHDRLMAYRVGQACGDIEVSEPTSSDAGQMDTPQASHP